MATGWDLKSYRTTFINPDYRREPKSQHFCCRCQKDLNPGQPHRMIHLVDGGPFALHPGDEARYQATTAAIGQHPGELGCFPIGMDCARQVGVEWTYEPAEAA